MTTIPIIASAADIPGAIRHAERDPASRWYVARRLEALGCADKVPGSWGITAAASAPARPAPPKRLTRRQGAGKLRSMTAAGWDSDLHPRDRKGRFIEKGDLINAFDSFDATTVAFRGIAVGNGKTHDGREYVEVRALGTNPDGTEGPVGATHQVPVDQIESAPAQKARLDGAKDDEGADTPAQTPEAAETPTKDLRDPAYVDRTVAMTRAESDARIAHRLLARDEGDTRNLKEIDAEFYDSDAGKMWKAGEHPLQGRPEMTPIPVTLNDGKTRFVLEGKLYEQTPDGWRTQMKNPTGPKAPESQQIVDALDSANTSSMTEVTDGVQPADLGDDGGAGPESVDINDRMDQLLEDEDLSALLDDDAAFNLMVDRLENEGYNREEVEGVLRDAITNDLVGMVDAIMEQGDTGDYSPEEIAGMVEALEKAGRGDKAKELDNVATEAGVYDTDEAEDDEFYDDEDQADVASEEESDLDYNVRTALEGRDKQLLIDDDDERNALADEIASEGFSREDVDIALSQALEGDAPAPVEAAPESATGAWEEVNDQDRRIEFADGANAQVTQDELGGPNTWSAFYFADGETSEYAEKHDFQSAEEAQAWVDSAHESGVEARDHTTGATVSGDAPPRSEQEAFLLERGYEQDVLDELDDDELFADFEAEGGMEPLPEDHPEVGPDFGTYEEQNEEPAFDGPVNPTDENGNEFELPDSMVEDDLGTQLSQTTLEDLAPLRDFLDVDSGSGSWASGLNSENMRRLAEYFDDWDDDNESVPGWVNDKLVEVVDWATSHDVDVIDAIHFRAAMNDAGWSINEQLTAILNGESLDEQNPSALAQIAGLLRHGGIGLASFNPEDPDAISARELADDIENYLERTQASTPDAGTDAPGDPTAERDVAVQAAKDEVQSEFGDDDISSQFDAWADAVILEDPEGGADTISEFLSVAQERYRDKTSEGRWAAAEFDEARELGAKSAESPGIGGADNLEIEPVGDPRDADFGGFRVWAVTSVGRGGRGAFPTRDAAQAYIDGYNEKYDTTWGPSSPHGMAAMSDAELADLALDPRYKPDSPGAALEDVRDAIAQGRYQDAIAEIDSITDDFTLNGDDTGSLPDLRDELARRVPSDGEASSEAESAPSSASEAEGGPYAGLSDADLTKAYNNARAAAKGDATDPTVNDLRDEIDRRGLNNVAAQKTGIAVPANPEAASKVRLMARSAEKESTPLTFAEADDRLAGILNSGDPTQAHKDMAKLMTELKLGGKQRKRYREALDEYFGTGGGDSASVSAAATADNLSDSNPVKERLKKKAEAYIDTDSASYAPATVESVRDSGVNWADVPEGLKAPINVEGGNPFGAHSNSVLQDFVDGNHGPGPWSTGPGGKIWGAMDQAKAELEARKQRARDRAKQRRAEKKAASAPAEPEAPAAPVFAPRAKFAEIPDATLVKGTKELIDSEGQPYVIDEIRTPHRPDFRKYATGSPKQGQTDLAGWQQRGVDGFWYKQVKRLVPAAPRTDAEMNDERNMLENQELAGTGYSVKELLNARNVTIEEIEQEEARPTYRGRSWVTVKVPGGSEVSVSTDLARRELGLPARPTGKA